MPAGRPRKPNAVLELSGAFRKNPQRRRARQAAQAAHLPPIGEPPQQWVAGGAHNPRFAELLGIWKELVAQDVLGVLNVSHRALLELACYGLYKIRRANAAQGKATSGDYAQFKATLAAMGMTPIDSSRVAEAVRVPDRGAQRPGSAAAGGGWGELVG